MRRIERKKELIPLRLGQDNQPEPIDDPNGASGKQPANGAGPDNASRPSPVAKNGNFMGRGGLPWIIAAILGVLILILLFQTNPQAKQVSWQQFYTYAKNKQFTEPVTIEDNRIYGKLKEPVENGVTAVSTPISKDTKVLYANDLKAVGQDTTENSGAGLMMQLFLYYGPFIILLVAAYFFIIRPFRNAGAGGGMLGSFGRSRHRVMTKEHSNITLDDVAGIEEAKDEVIEIIEFLKNPKRFQRLGGRVPRGVLLIGSPGCGKTLLAKAVAGEAEVPFFSISGSDFVEMFVGVGASRVRDLFKQAKDNAPCIIFLDEIDAVGRRRGSGFSSGGHDEREQTLNAILVEMDGFDSSDQVIVMAATNRNDVLDPALTRPGRFDRQINVPLPDIKGRVEILKVHSRKIKMSPDVDLERLARGTPMFSGAELAAIINESAIAATLSNKDFVEQEDLEEARDKVKFGKARKSQKIEQNERVSTAYHEAGHAVLQHQLKHADPLHKVTIIPRGQAMGATMGLPEKDRYGYGQNYLHDTMRVMCGGRIAEKRKTDDVTSGAAMDIRMATQMARLMVLEWGMSDKLGFVDYTPHNEAEALMPEKPYSNETAHQIDEEIKRLVDEAYRDAETMLNESWDKVVAVAEALLKYETLTADEVDRIMRGESLKKPTVAELLEMEKQKKAAPPDRQPVTPKPEEDSPPAPGTLPSPA